MTDKDRFILAEKIQKKVQEKLPHFQLIKKKNEIEKQLKKEIGAIGSYRQICIHRE
jgi:hypothetical protein